MTRSGAPARLGAPLPLRLSGLSCRYGRRTVVEDVHLDVAAGTSLAVTGANGAGKSTLLRAVLGLHPATGGEIRVGGERAGGRAAWARRRRQVAWVPQRLTPGSFPLLVHELLASSGNLPGALDAAERLGVGDLGERPLHTLSGGQLQRSFLARALGCVAAGAGVLMADEPTAALDFGGQAEVAGLLASLPVTVVVVSHDRAVADACDRRVEMAAGRLREAP